MSLNVRLWMPRCLMTGLALAALLSSGCDEPIRDLVGPSPNLVPTFDSIRREIFESTDLAGRTACTPCHTNVGRNPAGNRNLAGDAYAALVNVASRQRPELMLVAPGNPEASYLIHKLDGRSGIIGLQMPRSGPSSLTAGQLQVIRRWIEIGAPR